MTRQPESPDNPFAGRLVVNAGPFSGQKAFYISAFVGFLLSLVAYINIFYLEPLGIFYEPVHILFFITSLALIISLPLFLTYVATAVAVTYSQSEEFTYLLLTNIDEGKIVRGYLYAAFYRCRAICALIFMLCFTIAIAFKGNNMGLTDIYPDTWGYGWPESLIRHLIMGLLIAAMVGTLSFMGAALGILFGLWWRHTIVANAVATIIVFAGGLWWFDTLGQFLYGLGLFGFAKNVWHALLYLLLPGIIGWVSLKLARQWARKARRYNKSPV